MNLKALEKLATILAAKKSLEQNRFLALKRSQENSLKEATLLRKCATQSLQIPEISGSGVQLKNYAIYVAQLSSRAGEKDRAAQYLDTNINAQRKVLQNALHEETAIDALSDRAREQERKTKLEQEEKFLELLRFSKK